MAFFSNLFRRLFSRPAPPTVPTSPGQGGASATTEVDPRRVGPVHTTYRPSKDGTPDPGEVVWTWVPFQEHDGRGKDRPVLIVATLPKGPRGAVLAVQLTSKSRDGDPHFVPVGSGGWDGANRPSWVNLRRVVRVLPEGMRRESVALPRAAFDRVVARLDQLYGWH